MVAGVLLGIPTLRLRGDYLAIVTLGFGEIVTIFANNLYGITGGSFGSGGSTGKVSIPHFSIHLGPIHYVWTLSPVPYYYLALVFIVVFHRRVHAARTLAYRALVDRDSRGRGRRRIGGHQPVEVQGHGLCHRRRECGIRGRRHGGPVQLREPGATSRCRSRSMSLSS